MASYLQCGPARRITTIAVKSGLASGGGAFVSTDPMRVSAKERNAFSSSLGGRETKVGVRRSAANVIRLRMSVFDRPRKQIGALFFGATSQLHTVQPPSVMGGSTYRHALGPCVAAVSCGRAVQNDDGALIRCQRKGAAKHIRPLRRRQDVEFRHRHKDGCARVATERSTQAGQKPECGHVTQSPSCQFAGRLASQNLSANS